MQRYYNSYNSFTNVLFIVYRAIPFAFEITTLLDYSVRETTLEFTQYLKVEDFYAELYATKCARVIERKEPRKFGEKQPASVKCLQGVLLLAGLVFLIWFPLLLLSSGFPTSSRNLLEGSTLSIGIKGWENWYVASQTEALPLVSNTAFDHIRFKNRGILKDEKEIVKP